jgi:transporter family-2 protein
LSDPRFLVFSALGALAGATLAVQSVLNATLAHRAGILPALVVLALIGTSTLMLLALLSPSQISLRSLPGLSHWYLYLGGFLGVLILATPVFLVPRIGTAATLISIVFGQLALALVLDHFGFLGTPRIAITPTRALGVLIAAVGAFFVVR